MADYKKMYLTLFSACEDAIRGLVAAQQACEEIYMSQEETKLTFLGDGKGCWKEDNDSIWKRFTII